MIKRGRPKKTEGQLQDTKNIILKATREVFGLHGSQGLTVAKIIQTAGISRPTFYKYFDNVETPLNTVIQGTNLQLVKQVIVNAKGVSELIPLFKIITDTYLEWGQKEIDIISSIHQELLNPKSLVCKHRSHTITSLYQLVQSELGKQNKPIPDPIIIETIMMAAENIGYHILLNPNAANIKEYRSSLIKVAISLLGNKEDWSKAIKNEDLFTV